METMRLTNGYLLRIIGVTVHKSDTCPADGHSENM